MILGLFFWFVFPFDWETKSYKKAPGGQLVAYHLQSRSEAGEAPYWPLPEAEIENLINQTEIQWAMVENRFGKSISVEFVREERIAKSFIKYLFIQKFENHAIRWEIIFYKPRDTWKINMIKWDDNIQLLFSN